MVVVSVINFKQLTYDDYVFPPWANWVGWGIALSSMTLVPAYIAYKFLSTRGSLWEVSSAQGESAGHSPPGRGILSLGGDLWVIAAGVRGDTGQGPQGQTHPP